MSWKKGKSRALRLRARAEAWAKEAEQELEMTEGDIEPVTQAMRGALERRLRHPPAGTTA